MDLFNQSFSLLLVVPPEGDINIATVLTTCSSKNHMTIELTSNIKEESRLYCYMTIYIVLPTMNTYIQCIASHHETSAHACPSLRGEKDFIDRLINQPIIGRSWPQVKLSHHVKQRVPAQPGCTSTLWACYNTRGLYNHC